MRQELRIKSDNVTYILTTNHSASSYGIPVLLIGGTNVVLGPDDDPSLHMPGFDPATDLFGGVKSPFKNEAARTLMCAANREQEAGRVFTADERALFEAFCPGYSPYRLTHLEVRWDADSDPTKPGWVAALLHEDGSYASSREWQPVDAPGDADDEDLIDAAHDTARFEGWYEGEVRITRPE